MASYVIALHITQIRDQSTIGLRRWISLPLFLPCGFFDTPSNSLRDFIYQIDIAIIAWLTDSFAEYEWGPNRFVAALVYGARNGAENHS